MIEDLVEQLRRETKFGAARLAAVLKADHGVVVAPYRLTAEGITDVELPKRPNEQLDLFDDE